MQVVFVGAFDAHRRDLAPAQRAAACDVDNAVDLRRVAARAPLGHGRAGAHRIRLAAGAVSLVDDHLLTRADSAPEASRGDRLLMPHEAMPALLLHRVGDRGGKLVGERACNRLVTEAADAVEFCLIEPIEQAAEILFTLAGKADDEGRADGEIGADVAPAGDALQGLLLRGRPFHPAQHGGCRMLKRDVEIGQHLALCHQRDDLVHMRVGVDVVQPHPGAELAKCAGEIEKFRPHLAPLPRARRIFEVDPVGRSVLRNNQKLLHARGDEALGLAQHVGGGPRDQIAPQFRDDAEAAAIVAALRNLQIGIVPGRKLDALGGRRSTNRSWRGGSARCTAATTLSYCCGPVIASTPGYRAVIFSGSAPMQPVTITLPFSLSAWPMAASDSAWALSRKPQVLTTARSAPAWERASSYPSARRRVMMRSLSTSAFGQPSETKLTRGARGAGCRFSMARGYPSA